MNNKRGQELSTNTIIMVILGIIVLVVLVLGFTIGWNRLFPFISQSNNVNTIKTACASACTQGDTYGFCTQNRTLKAEDLPGGIKEKTEICKFFATDANYKNYGVEDCSSITCP